MPLILSRLSFWGFALFAFVLTHLPPTEFPQVGVPGIDKVVHFFLYFGLGWLFGWAYPAFQNHRRIVASGLFLYAAIDEVTQPWVGRTAEVLDWGCDVLGILIGLDLFHRFNKSESSLP